MNMKTFAIDSKLNYEEFYCGAGQINKYYEIENPGTKSKISTIPDACLDIQFAYKNGRFKIYACGSFMESDKSPTGKQDWCFGVKFNPGAVPEMIRDSVMELIGSRKVLDGIPWLDQLAGEILAAHSFWERVDVFEEKFPFDEQFEKENQIVEYVKSKIQESHGCIHIAKMAEEMQYNQKYMDRVFRTETGFTMKKFAMIIRIQTAIGYLLDGRTDDVYEMLGYYDQSYFIKEFKKNTSMTPRQFCTGDGICIV